MNQYPLAHSLKRCISLLLGAVILFAPGRAVFAWGSDGHQTVGKIASLRILPRTTREIARILKPGETLANISTWADKVKERVGETDPDPDTNAFLQDIVHNEKNREWHYVNLPLNCRSYQTCDGYTRDDDIVHMLNVSIRTLQGHPDPAQPLSKRNALKLLVHLVGDIHQPLHVGTGYIDVNGPNGTILVVRDPEVIKRRKLPNDKGGNDIVIDNDRQNLHGFWDFGLVTSLMTTTNRQTSDKLGRFLRQSIRPQVSWSPRGQMSNWAAEWATDSLHLSRNNAYRSVAIVGQRTIPVLRDDKPVVRNGQPVMQTVYDITRANSYDTVNRQVVRQQLAKAGFRLAKLLDAIYQ